MKTNAWCAKLYCESCGNYSGSLEMNSDSRSEWDVMWAPKIVFITFLHSKIEGPPILRLVIFLRLELSVVCFISWLLHTTMHTNGRAL